MIQDLLKISKTIIYHPLSKMRKVNALAAFVRWQIGSAILGKKVVIPWINDCKFIIGKGERGLSANIYTGLSEYEDMAFVLHCLRPSDHFVDVGANVGAYTLIAAKVIGCTTTAIEPVPETFRRLRDQIIFNDISDRVNFINKGVGSRKALLCFTSDRDATNRVLKEGETSPNSVLDSLIHTQRPLFIKIDVEGYEHEVLDGCDGLFDTGHIVAIIIELNGFGEKYGHTDTGTHLSLLRRGFIPVRYRPANRSFIKLDRPNNGSRNTIYIREPDLIRQRLLESQRYFLHTVNSDL